ncbi:MAG: hypothetical protein CSA70_11535 [Rhodobacterales bacterium]|nr:MAG: hypothetical protein CSA70_11535 [Rhodobacterales bacterium]
MATRWFETMGDLLCLPGLPVSVEGFQAKGRHDHIGPIFWQAGVQRIGGDMGDPVRGILVQVCHDPRMQARRDVGGA